MIVSWRTSTISGNFELMGSWLWVAANKRTHPRVLLGVHVCFGLPGVVSGFGLV